jgi:hypothetical protein
MEREEMSHKEDMILGNFKPEARLKTENLCVLVVLNCDMVIIS